MKNLIVTLAVAAMLPLGGQALAAQEAHGPMHADSVRAAHHTARVHGAKRHTTRHRRTHRTATHHARMHTSRTSSMGAMHASPSARTMTMRPSGPQRMANGMITAEAARAIALRSVPGGTSIDKLELHEEDGRQVYDVKVLTPNRPGNETVRVDAMTGSIVKTKHVDDPLGNARRAVDRTVNKIRR